MKIIFIVLIVLFLLAKSTDAAAVWSQIQTSTPSGSQYAPAANYGFQISWTGSDVNYTISNVYFESDLSGSLNNTTVSSASDVYSINFTDLPAKNYVYRWYASDNESNWNSTDQISYVINKNNSTAISLYLNGASNNKSYNLNSIANFTASLNLPNKSVSLSSSFPGFATQTGSSVIYNYTNLSSYGFFSLTASWDGDENYSSSSKTYYFDTMPPQYSSNSVDPASPAAYYSNLAYTFSIVWTGANLGNALFESNYSGSLKNYTASTSPPVQNSSNNFFIKLIDLPAENFTYRWIAVDSLNRINSTDKTTYQIVKSGPLRLEISPSATVKSGTETTVICYSYASEVNVSNFKLFRNSTLVDNLTAYMRRDVQTLGEGIYQYICNSSETQNYTSQTLSFILNVTSQPQNITGTLALNGPSSFQLNLNDSAEEDFYLINNLGGTLYNITVNLTGISSGWYNISNIPDSVPNNFSSLIKINFSIPFDAEQKEYDLNLVALGKYLNVTNAAAKTINLTVTSPSPPQTQTFPPVYLADTENTTSNGNFYEFALEWNDDSGLSGYIFSSNITGNWTNDSWIPLPGTEGWSYANKNVSLNPGSTIAWKFYMNDSNNLWTESQEFYLQAPTVGAINMAFPIIAVSVFVVVLAVLLLVINQRRSKKKTPKKEDVVYVYNQGDLK